MAKKPGAVTLKNVRLAFPVLFTPEGTPDDPDRKRFSASFLIAKDDTANMKAVQNAMNEVSAAKWGAKAEKTLQALSAADKTCVRDGDLKDWDGYEGHFYISAKRDSRPGVYDADKSPLQAEDGKPYAGCYVNAAIELWAQDNQWGKRINAQLRGVQFFRDGDAFAGGQAADADEFEDVSTASDFDEDDL